MQISNEQIIQSARRQREAVNNSMDVEPWSHGHRRGRGLAAVIGIAASLVSFIAGYGLHANMSQSDIQPLAQTIKVQHDTIMQKETLRDTRGVPDGPERTAVDDIGNTAGSDTG